MKPSRRGKYTKSLVISVTDAAHYSREQRISDLLDANMYTGRDGVSVVRRDKANVHTQLSNREHIVQEMHDILKAYYKVARKRIVDVIIMQAVDYHLLSGPESPLGVFTPELVSTLPSEELERIAGEDDLTKAKRETLLKTIGDLEKGKKVLQGA
jgi:hypothetical protein